MERDYLFIISKKYNRIFERLDIFEHVVLKEMFFLANELSKLLSLQDGTPC